jgi:hypothetical protein
MLLGALAAAGAYFLWREKVRPEQKAKVRGWVSRLRDKMEPDDEEI